MNTIYSISKAERALLITFTFIVFALFAAGISTELIQSFNDAVSQHQLDLARQAGAKNIISFSSSGPYYGTALFHLITLPIVLALIKAKKYIVSTVLTIVYGSLLGFSVSMRMNGEGAFGSENFLTDPFNEFWMKTSFNDYFAAAAIAIMLFWQGTILWRLRTAIR